MTRLDTQIKLYVVDYYLVRKWLYKICVCVCVYWQGRRGNLQLELGSNICICKGAKLERGGEDACYMKCIDHSLSRFSHLHFTLKKKLHFLLKIFIALRSKAYYTYFPLRTTPKPLPIGSKFLFSSLFQTFSVQPISKCGCK